MSQNLYSPAPRGPTDVSIKRCVCAPTHPPPSRRGGGVAPAVAIRVSSSATYSPHQQTLNTQAGEFASRMNVIYVKLIDFLSCFTLFHSKWVDFA